jgi:ankyrin repeat protein
VSELLLANRADINAKDNDGYMPLRAASRGYKHAAELLLSRGTEVNTKDNEGHTLLHLAAIHKDMVELLHQHGGHE